MSCACCGVARRDARLRHVLCSEAAPHNRKHFGGLTVRWTDRTKPIQSSLRKGSRCVIVRHCVDYRDIGKADLLAGKLTIATLTSHGVERKVKEGFANHSNIP